MNEYLRQAVSNGVPLEQALIRRWWHQCEGARGCLVWEYHLEGRYADGVLFTGRGIDGGEQDGRATASRFPLRDSEVIMCEAKRTLTPEVIGQALVYNFFARRAGAKITRSLVFAERGEQQMIEAATALGLWVVLDGVTPYPPTGLEP